MDKQSTRLERPELFLVEYPMKRMTVAFMLFIVAALLYFQGLKYLSNYHGITTITAALTLAFGFLILSVVTVDTLEVSKRDRTMQFQRKGLFRYEQKTFKFNQIKGLVIGNENKRCSMKTISIYRLQATLITNGRAELFRSYSKRHIRESVILVNLVRPVIKVLGSRVESTVLKFG